MNKPLTKERALEAMRQSQHISAWPIQRTSKLYSTLLKDPEFANKALVIISEKIAAIERGEIAYATGTNARTVALAGWKQALKQVEAALNTQQQGINSR